MNNTAVNFVLTIPLGSSAHRSAVELCRQHTDRETAKQVYLNALAVNAVNFYFECLEIETDLAASDIWNSAVQRFMDVADLEIKDIGKLECRWVAPGADFVSIPVEVRSDRIGYVVVELAESLKDAKLLGFVEKADREQVALSELKSIDNLLEYLDALKPVNLSQWFDNVVAPSWKSLSTLFDSAPKLQWAFRSPEVLEAGAAKSATIPIKRGKTLSFERGKEQVALVVGLSKNDGSEIDISVEVYATNGHKNLPPDLQLIVLDDAGETLMQARANKTDNLLFELSGEPGEHFSVKVTLGDFSVTEKFLI